MDDMLAITQRLKGRWMIGGSAIERAPANWREAITEDGNPEVALLAIAGQALQFGLEPVPGEPLRPARTLPRLCMPAPPEQARTQIRHLLRVHQSSAEEMTDVVRLLAARGYSMHPLDYMPATFDDLPDIYDPWAIWKYAESNEATSDAIALQDENWDSWDPAERLRALALLRRNDPGKATALIANNTPNLPAKLRLPIVELLAQGLSQDDLPLLQSLTKDRSGKVRQIVHRLLGRLGVAEDDPEELAEFADYFTLTQRRGGGHKLTANKLKTGAQYKRRSELSERLSLQSLTQAFQLTEQTELVAAWHHRDDAATDEFLRMLAGTGSQPAIAHVARRLTSLPNISFTVLKLLFDRLSLDQRSILLPQVLIDDNARLSATVVCAQGLWGTLSLEQIQPTQAMRELEKVNYQALNSYQPAGFERLTAGLRSLGLLADQPAAQALLNKFSAGHYPASVDPMLGILKLNACLPPGDHCD